MEPNVLNEAKAALEGLDTDKIVSAYHDDFVFEDVPGGQRITNKTALRTYFQSLFSLPGVAFTDISIHEGETSAAIEWTWCGDKVSSPGVYRIRGASVIELREGKIARESIYYDPTEALPG